MNPFKLRRPRWLEWRFFISLFLAIALLAIVVPWQRVKTWSRIECAKHGPALTRRVGIFFLGIEGDDPKVVVPVLLACLEDKNYAVRETAALSLGHIHQYPDQVVPALLTALGKEQEDSTKRYMVGAMCQYGTNARPWSPIFLQMIQSNGFGFVFGSPLFALKKIDPEVGGPLVDQYNADISNRQRQTQLDFNEKQRHKALSATNPPPIKP